ncbi:thiolase domain-containing protein [Shouchella sp. JSM 1781072]|uniref:thiolase C-terminal domain-containing protein n=1 Tax=Bacillaceae TaxID=186817 RepID=UPI000C08012B|nr:MULTISPECIES: acetyl-CoA acetyltransferase [Bacillaceae]UTR08265.1 thiolase domain-containing protein [Alkalihalobacillus sp. LMS6]
MSRVAVTGVGMTRFGKSNDSLKTLLLKASRQALIDAGRPKVDAIIVGNFMGGPLAQQEILGSILVTELGLGHIPSMKTEGACASGGIAFRQAYQLLKAGAYNSVLVVGGEKMTHIQTNHVISAVNHAMDNSSMESKTGLTFPGYFGVVANRYMYEYGATKSHLAMVAFKNRNYARQNPLSQFQAATSLEEILSARMITDPLGLFDCSPISDGAAAVVVQNVAREGVEVIASGQASGTPIMQEVDDLTRIPATEEAAKQAYSQAAMGPNDVDVLELHDCFSMTEIIAIEELGFFERGTGFEAVEKKLTNHGGDIPVNTSGGLLSKGHPIGATGIAQIVHIVEQLRGTAPNQVEHARVGMAQNLGGTGAYSLVHLFKKEGA